MTFIFFIVISILFGFIMGSFLNVVSLRINTGKSLKGRSMCFSCSRILKWYELIPIFSWLSQRGRCNNCSSRISPELLVSELISGLFFGFIAARGFFTNNFLFDSSYIVTTLFLFIIASVLIIILFYDIRHKIIPDKLSLIFGLLSLLSLFFFSFENSIFGFVGFTIPSLWQLLAGVIIPLPFVVIWILSNGRLIGLGDPKLMIGMGLLLGISKGFSAVFISFWIGALFSISLLIINRILYKDLVVNGKNSIMKKEVPFAPFLIIGTLITIIFNINVLPL